MEEPASAEPHIKYIPYFVGLEVFTAVPMKNAVF
jgi:hypothetical protein